MTESAGAPDPAGSGGEPDKPWHELDWESFERHAADVLAGPYGTGLRSPFWAGSEAPRSPFWAGLQ